MKRLLMVLDMLALLSLLQDLVVLTVGSFFILSVFVGYIPVSLHAFLIGCWVGGDVYTVACDLVTEALLSGPLDESKVDKAAFAVGD